MHRAHAYFRLKPLFFGSSLLLCLICQPASVWGQSEIPQRVTPWTSSNIKGSPEPPLPYRTQRVYQQVQLQQPTDIVWLPAAQRWIATQVNGTIVTFGSDRETATAQPFLDLNESHEKPVSNTVSTTFHPDLENHPWCYVCYASKLKDPLGRHLVRYKVTDPKRPAIDVSSRVELLSWNGDGHSGGSVQFGPDGYLYLSVGDGQPPYPPDEQNTGQNISDLEASILRIDVNYPTAEQPYRIPQDNPFVGDSNSRGEIWAFGFRNPWKMAFNPANGELFVADVGWEMREMVYRVQRGGNYGWSIMEGSQPVKKEQAVVPISPPIFEHSHFDCRSITGGAFWQSERLPELIGAYIYGDWMTGKVWALKTEGDRVLWHKELVDTSHQIICFMLDPLGEVLIVGYDGAILQLLANDAELERQEFPKQLSSTGLFADTKILRPMPGVIEYEISAHHWADGTHSRQWIAIPGREQLGLWEHPRWDLGQVHGHFKFPEDTVLAKTVSYFADPANPSSEIHIETQILHLLGEEFRAYNYIWNAEQSDAWLQGDVATEVKLAIQDATAPNGIRNQTWRHSSRSECLLCHIWSSGTVQGFTPDQLNITWRNQAQFPNLVREGLFGVKVPQVRPIAAPHDSTRTLEERARSYLALNCSNCHRPQGGGTANFNFDHTKKLAENRIIDAAPAQGDFGIADARVVAPGDPFRSIVLYRTLKYGRGHMPQFGSTTIDRKGVALLHDWIASLPGNSADHGQLKERSASLSNKVGADREILEMLSSTRSAVALSYECSRAAPDDAIQQRILELGSQHSEPQIRDLFEGLLPEHRRIQRLGTAINEPELLATQGLAANGKALFESAADVSCRQCHQLGAVGKQVGPDLSGVGMQMTPAELLSSIVRPAEKINPAFRTRTVLTVDGKVATGIVVSENDSELVLSDSQNQLQSIAKADIDRIQYSSQSMMPERLQSGLTMQQAADLLAFLATQRKPGPLHHKHATIRRTQENIAVDGKLTETAWRSAESLGDFVFPWWNEGDPAPQQTEAKVLWNDDYLFVSFRCLDKNVLAARTTRDSDVYRDDCVEVFASPQLEHPENYFNLEINASGVQLDNYRPQGKEPKQPWNPEGILVASAIDGTVNDATDIDRSWTMEVAIPFRLFKDVLPLEHPKLGDSWRLNLHRLEDNMALKSQWSQGDRNLPNFHTPELFGFVTFGE